MKIVVIYAKPAEAEINDVPDSVGSSLVVDLESKDLFISRPGHPGLSIPLDSAERVYVNPYPGQMPPAHQKLFDAADRS